jgi:hypothetical protein
MSATEYIRVETPRGNLEAVYPADQLNEARAYARLLHREFAERFRLVHEQGNKRIPLEEIP